jgi:hypothetical protein
MTGDAIQIRDQQGGGSLRHAPGHQGLERGGGIL